MSNINQYPLEAFQINDEDFYDVDYWNGVSYETRKISGATIKLALGGENIYNLDGTLSGNRTLTGGGFDLSFIQLLRMFLQIAPPNGSEAFKVDVDTTSMSGGDNLLEFYDIPANIKRIQFNKAGFLVINESYALPPLDGSAGQLLQTNGAGSVSFVSVSSALTTTRNISSSQWERVLTAPSPLPNGSIANGFTFFDNTADRTIEGNTLYDQYDIQHGISLLFSGTSGSGTITINSIGYGVNFNVDIPTTINDFITANASAIEANCGVRIFQVNDFMRFGGDEAILNGILYVQNAVNLNAVKQNEFTGGAVASGDHLTIPYFGKPWENQRLHHTFRVNFNIVTGSTQTLALSLRRFSDDSIIGSEIPVFRSLDVEGVQQTFATFTYGPNDPFVQGGFYFALRNDSGSTVEIDGQVGILIQNMYEKGTEI